MAAFKFKKSVQALNYFTQKEGGKINYMKAGKLVYLADRAHLRTYGRSITNDTYVAMKNGSVPSRTKDIISKSEWWGSEIVEYSDHFLTAPEGYNISSVGDVDTSVFSKTDLKIIEQIYDYYGERTQFELSEYSHHFPEWKRFESELKLGIGKMFVIEPSDFFENGLKDEPFSQSEELLDLSKKHFNHEL